MGTFKKLLFPLVQNDGNKLFRKVLFSMVQQKMKNRKVGEQKIDESKFVFVNNLFKKNDNIKE